MKRLLVIFSLLLCMMLQSCIQNDIPCIPNVPSVVSASAEGASSVSIDKAARTVTFTFDESVDLAKVTITKVEFSTQVKCSTKLEGVHDMLSPLVVTVTTNGDYQWTFKAVQNIAREFKVEGQLGTSEIDVENRRVIVSVSASASLSDIKVLSMKLGPSDITSYEPSMSAIKDFTDYAVVQVSYYGRTEEWHLFVVQKESLAEIISVSPWSRVAYLKCSGMAGKDNGVRYRKSGESEWTDVKAPSQEASYVVALDGLETSTSYDCVAYCADSDSDKVVFETQQEQQLPNNSFEDYCHQESANYFSMFPEGGTKWWDSGNAGSTMIGEAYCICTPDTQDFKHGKNSIHLISRNVVVKFAAGNIFSGEFAGVIGTKGGKVNFGHPFTLRPRCLKFWAKYDCGAIDCIGSVPEGRPVKAGDNDICCVQIALGTWDYRKYGGTPESPVQVNTTDKSTFFNPQADAVIAYGNWTSDKSTDGWVEIEIPLEYRDFFTMPTHIVVSCAASALGDYFTGSSKSQLWLDDLRLVY